MTITATQASPSEAVAEKPIARPLTVAVVLVLLWQFRRFLLSGFDTLSGDIADSRIEIALLEHWLSVLRGYAAWPAANFFHPWPGVLGFTDAHLLLAAPYGLMRALGADPFLAHELLHVALRAAACVGAALVLFRVLRLPVWVSVFGGALFALQNAWAIHIGHIQLLAYFFVPWIVLAIDFALRPGSTMRRVSAWLATGLLIGALPLTSFTASWYSAALLAVGLLACALVLAGVRTLRPDRATLRAAWRNAWPASLPGALVLLIGLVQFIRLYLPQSRTFGGYAPQVALETQVTPHEWFAVGSGNYLWGWAERLWGAAATAESTTSLTPVLFVTMLAGGVFVALRGEAMPRRWRLGALLCALTALLWLLLITRFGPISAWRLVHAFVPGGKALRALGRAQLVLPLVAIPVACIALAWLVRRRQTGFAVVLAVLLLAEQANSGYYGPVALHALFRSAEAPLLASVPAPPGECRVFYVVRAFERPMFPNPDFISRGYGPAVDAMLIAQRFHVPTANGVSTWFPPGWGPFRVDDPAYVTGMRNWLRTHGAVKGVCELDLEGRSWTVLGDL